MPPSSVRRSLTMTQRPLLRRCTLGSPGTVLIADDTGGQIGPYLAKYRALRASGERVEIDGTCASACTMLLGIITGFPLPSAHCHLRNFSQRIDADNRDPFGKHGHAKGKSSLR